MNAPARLGWHAALTDRAFLVHYLQMLAAMGIGMVVLGPLSMRMVHHAGTEIDALLMASTMVVATAAWMAYRKHRWPAIIEMSAVMYAAVAVLLPCYWLGVLGPTGLMILAHVLMVLGMAVAMLHRRDDYTTAR